MLYHKFTSQVVSSRLDEQELAVVSRLQLFEGSDVGGNVLSAMMCSRVLREEGG